MTPPEKQFEALHSVYQRLSGRSVPWTRYNMHRWAHLVHELNIPVATIEKALPLIIERIKRLSRGCSGFEHHLNFSKITDVSVFQDHWSAALAEARKPAPSANVVAMQQLTGKRYETPSTEAITAARALERTKLAEQLKAWREQNK